MEQFTSSATPHDCPRMRVLVAEDEPAIRLVLVNKLKQAGFDVISACNGEEALQLTRAERPHLIITDFEMPRLDGLAMARALFEDPATSDIPVVVLSARGHRLSAGDVKGTNVMQMLMKPFSMREVLAIVHELQDRFGPSQGAAA